MVLTEGFHKLLTLWLSSIFLLFLSFSCGADIAPKTQPDINKSTIPLKLISPSEFKKSYTNFTLSFQSLSSKRVSEFFGIPTIESYDKLEIFKFITKNTLHSTDKVEAQYLVKPRPPKKNSIHIEDEIESIKVQLKDAKSTNLYRLLITGGLGLLALTISLYNIANARKNKNSDTNKSLIDDYWFRQIFLAHINEKMHLFNKKWSTKKAAPLRGPSINNREKIISLLLSDIAQLRDAASTIQVINSSMRDEFDSLFDDLESQMLNPNELDSFEEIQNTYLNKMYALSFKFHNIIVKYDFNFKKLSTIDLEYELANL